MKTSARLEGVSEYYFSMKLREVAELNAKGKNILNFGIGSPDLPPHPDVIAELHARSNEAGNHSYQSYKGSPVLRNGISDWYDTWYGVRPDPEKEILPLIGSKEGIVHISMTYLDAGDRVLVPEIGYPAYSAAARLAGAEPVFYPLREDEGWAPDFDALEKMDLSGVRLMWMNYPHMPTGGVPTTKMFRRAIDFAAARGILIAHDNPYSFILNDTPMSMMSLDGAFENAIELNSLSKSHNMAGWRVGMLIGNREHIDNVLRFKSNLDSGMFLPVQLASSVALRLPAEWYMGINAVYAKRRETALRLLEMTGCEYGKEGAGMFLWAKVPDGETNGYSFSDRLLYNHNIFITPGGVFGDAGKNYIRVSLCAREELFAEALTRLEKNA